MMKRFFFLVLLLLLFTFKSFAQNGIRAFQAVDSIGKIVQFTATVIDVRSFPNSKAVAIGLSDWRNKEELLTLIVHQTHYHKSSTKWLLSLKGQLISFKGKVLNHNGHAVIKAEIENIGISEVMAIPGVAATVKETRPAGKSILANDAANHIGELVTICDTAHDYSMAGDSLVVLNFGVKSPDQLTISSKANNSSLNNQAFDHHHFTFDAGFLKGKHICVTGRVTLYHNAPQLLITDPAQIFIP